MSDRLTLEDLLWAKKHLEDEARRPSCRCLVVPGSYGEYEPELRTARRNIGHPDICPRHETDTLRFTIGLADMRKGSE